MIPAEHLAICALIDDMLDSLARRGDLASRRLEHRTATNDKIHELDELLHACREHHEQMSLQTTPRSAL